MSLGLEVRKQGRPGKAVTATMVRRLTAEDVAQQGPRDVLQGGLMRLRDRHHALARCLASGMSEKDAGIITGYVGSRISVLKADPSFKQLVEFYRSHNDDIYRDAYRDLHSKMAGLAEDTVEELSARLEEAPEQFDVSDLRETLKVLADRTGFGPATKSTNVNVTVDLAARLAEGIKRARETRTIEHKDSD